MPKKRLDSSFLNLEDSILLKDFHTEETLYEANSESSKIAASLIKVFFAAELGRRLEDGVIEDEIIDITPNMAVNEGTDILSDLVSERNKLRLRMNTLIGLMLKYSCNSSTKILVEKFLYPRTNLHRIAQESWGMKDTFLIDNRGEFCNRTSLKDLFSVFKYIYKKESPIFKLIQKKLKECINKYYLFDQLGVEVLGSKTGTFYENGIYTVGDIGLFRVNNRTFFIGAIIQRKSLSEAIQAIRHVGREVISG